MTELFVYGGQEFPTLAIADWISWGSTFQCFAQCLTSAVLI